MTVYRFAKAEFADSLSGEGSKRFGGRWNSKGNAVVYTSLTISLSLLELLIHSVSYDEILKNELTELELPLNSFAEIFTTQLKANWQKDENYSRYIGDEFLISQTRLLLKVPSVIIPEEHNILINPKHKDFKKIKIKLKRIFEFDVRLFKTDA
ncbi:MAG: RES family NAD+ phosphorylase [Chitinophagaceae bacterium]